MSRAFTGTENLASHECRPAGSTLLDGLVLIENWLERARQRRTLRGLSDDALHDIALSRADAEFEGRKHFWRP